MATTPQPIRTVKAFYAGRGIRSLSRDVARKIIISLKASRRNPTGSTGWVRFPYYHHVFDDERAGFEKHLRYYKSIADIISLDDALELMTGDTPIDGRYICITFDDGFKNWTDNALPILKDMGAVAAFFVATDYIGTDVNADRDKLLKFYDSGDKLMEFMTWDDCRSLHDAGMTVGSHSVHHAHLADIDYEAAQAEMVNSKKTIEDELANPCDHFCCPFGVPGVDFDTTTHPSMARDAGYKSFLTTRRGPNTLGADPFAVRRDHMLANASLLEVRYFLGAEDNL